jgi:hypothetical protein
MQMWTISSVVITVLMCAKSLCRYYINTHYHSIMLAVYLQPWIIWLDSLVSNSIALLWQFTSSWVVTFNWNDKAQKLQQSLVKWWHCCIRKMFKAVPCRVHYGESSPSRQYQISITLEILMHMILFSFKRLFICRILIWASLLQQENNTAEIGNVN